ncbi:hypothetical protein [uncultured Roseobacter sp.]|uniref:hypothetical protein n=1 Tax=uncultured Roseobacter sp. TaxID=114847 RepID=UPI0026116125|nr:hypothetical protein [uncultured Roseobacter sp.]
MPMKFGIFENNAAAFVIDSSHRRCPRWSCTGADIMQEAGQIFTRAFARQGDPAGIFFDTLNSIAVSGNGIVPGFNPMVHLRHRCGGFFAGMLKK